MYATSIGELVALVTLIKHREGRSQVAFTAPTLLLVMVQSYRSFVA
jgi:hypothetical protein